MSDMNVSLRITASIESAINGIAQVSAALSGLKKGGTAAKGAGAAIDGVGAAAKRAGAAGKKAGNDIGTGFAKGRKELSQMRAGMDSISKKLGALGNIGAIWASLSGVRNVVGSIFGVADAMQGMNARLRLATDGAAGFAQAQADVGRIASSSRTDLDSVATLYTRLAQNSASLGLHQKELANITEAVSLATTLSGGSAASAAAGVQQLAQAMASGVLSGDEFRSVMENSPRVVKAMTNQFGISVGELRNLAEDQKLSAKLVAEAMQLELDTLRNEMGKTPTTVGQAMTKIKNAWAGVVDGFMNGTGVSAELANTLSNVADMLTNTAGDASAMGSVMSALSTVIKFGIKMWLAFKNGVEVVAIAVAACVVDVQNVITTIRNLFSNAITHVKAYINAITHLDLGAAIDAVRGMAAGVGREMTAFQQRGKANARQFADEVARQAEDYAQGLAALNRQQDRSAEATGRQAEADAALAARQRALQDEIKRLVAANGNGSDSQNKAADAARRHAQELARLRKETADYINQTRQMQAELRGALFASDEKLAQDIAAANADRGKYGDAATDARIEALKAAAQKGVQDVIRQWDADLQEASGNTAAAAAARAAEQYQQQIAYFLSRGDAANAAKGQALQDLAVRQAQLDQLSAQVNRIFDETDRKVQETQTLVQIHALTELEARERIAGYYRDQATQVEAMLPGMAALAGNSQVMADSVQAMRDKLASYRTDIDSWQNQFAGDFQTSLSSAIQGLLTGAQTLREAVSNFASAIFNSIVKTWADNIAQFATSKLMGFLGGGDAASRQQQAAVQTRAAGVTMMTAAGMWTTTAAAIAGAAAALNGANAAGAAGGGSSGGGSGSWVSSILGVASSLFGFASGGPTPPGGKYQPAGIVHAGEYVMPQETVRAYGLDFLRAIHMRLVPRFAVPRVATPQPRFSFAEGGMVRGATTAPGAAPQVHLRNINVVDGAAVVSGYLDSPDSDEVFVNKIFRNEAAIRRVLGA